MILLFKKVDTVLLISERDVYEGTKSINHFQYFNENEHRALKIFVPQYESNSEKLVKILQPEIHSVIINIPALILSKIWIRKEFNWCRYKIAKYILIGLKTRNLVLTSFYDDYKQSWLSASIDLKINSIEIQHGHIYKNSKEYYQENNLLKPTRLFIWDNSYKQNISPDFYCTVIGNTLIKHKHDLNLKPKSILIVDQYTKFDELEIIITRVKEINKYCEIYVKPHPRSYSIEGYLDKLNNLNVKILNTKFKIYDIAHNFESIIGFYSTGLVESALCGIKTYSFKEKENQIFANLGESYIEDFNRFPTYNGKCLVFPEFKIDVMQKYLL